MILIIVHYIKDAMNESADTIIIMVWIYMTNR